MAGVTSVRDVGGDPDVLLPMREALAAGERVGPRLFVYGPMLDGDPPIFGRAAAGLSRLTRISSSVDEGEATVRELIASGVDGIKLYAGLRPDLVEAMIKAAGGRVPVAAHLGRTWASEAIESGVAPCCRHRHAMLALPRTPNRCAATTKATRDKNSARCFAKASWTTRKLKSISRRYRSALK